MQAFYSDQFVLPLPPGHRFPMAKYRMLRDQLAEHLPPEFDTNRAKFLICIGRASGLPLQQAQLGVV